MRHLLHPWLLSVSSVILALVLAILPSCGLSSRPYPLVRSFSLDLPAPPGAEDTSTPSFRPSAVILVNASPPPALYEGKKLIYRLNTNEFTADYYDEFYSPPARAVADSLATALNYDLPYLLVRTQGVRNPDYALEITVLDFYGDLSSEPQTVKVSLVATLNDLKPALPHLLFSRKYVRSLPIQLNLNETQAESFVKVLVAALAQIKGDLAFDLKEVLRVK